jgi:colanic acid/amylovoran biosynthesis protein
MRIVLSGIQTTNKGAELMLYAILQEIERKFPKATVFIPRNRIPQGLEYIKSQLDIRFIPYESFESKLRLPSVFRILHLPFELMPHMIAMGRVDYYLDGSGFKFSDQFNLAPKYYAILKQQLRAFKRGGTQIIYLPQAFGPLETSVIKSIMAEFNKSASILMPREQVSYDYIKDSHLVDMRKVKMFTDFTSIVEGIFPQEYSLLKNGICVIPNKQMINKGAMSTEDYLKLLSSIIKEAKKTGKTVFLLNHEGKEDKDLCEYLQSQMQEKIDVVTGLNAIEVKGLIAASYLVISSRFHGVASSLNSCVPCLATSWSHKYSELFKDYNQYECILPLNDLSVSLKMVRDYLQEDMNTKIRKELSKVLPQIQSETRMMWKTVWGN